MKTRVLIALALACAVPSATPAQEPVRIGAAPTAPRAFGAALLFGATTYANDPLHTVYGMRVSAERGDWGVLGLAALGRGGYDSSSFAAAATRSVLTSPAWRLNVLAGGGVYAESGPTGTERSAPGALIGLDLRRRLGPLSLYASATYFRGFFSGDDLTEGFTFGVPRLHIGIGY